MKVSKRTEYGLRAIVMLAERSHDHSMPVSLREIAALEQIPEAFLDQIFAMLRREGLVMSVRGATGGYLLANPPEQISMGQIIRILEGGIAPIGCVGTAFETPSEFCYKAVSCHTRNVWLTLYNSIEQTLDNITLADVIKEFQSSTAHS